MARGRLFPHHRSHASHGRPSPTNAATQADLPLQPPGASSAAKGRGGKKNKSRRKPGRKAAPAAAAASPSALVSKVSAFLELQRRRDGPCPATVPPIRSRAGSKRTSFLIYPLPATYFGTCAFTVGFKVLKL